VELVVFVVIVVAVAGLGLWLGMLAAPHIGRLAEPHEDESESPATGEAPPAEAGGPEETSERRDDE
jgi:hypothetical protein